jgi:hypothetical protein
MLALLTVLFAAGAVAPLWWRHAGSDGPARWPAVLLSLAAAAVAVAWFTAGEEVPREVRSRPIEVADDGYVGSASCVACHPGQHASWHSSFHRTMTQVIDREALVARFDRLELDWFGETVELEWRGDELWTRFERGGATPGPVDARIEQITGSHHLQVLWYSTGTGRELAPVPVCFKIEQGIWLPLTAVFVLPPDFRDPPEPGAWSQSCHACHATRVRPRIDTGFNDTLVTEFGISCEACHGPGLPVGIGADARKPTVDVHHCDRTLRLHDVDAPNQTGRLEHSDTGEIELEPWLAVLVHDQREQRPEHQVDRNDDADALPAAIGGKEEIRRPDEHHDRRQNGEDHQTDRQVDGECRVAVELFHGAFSSRRIERSSGLTRFVRLPTEI